MRSMFPGYYPPSPKEYERLWKEATFVLDTNVLLNLYRLPLATREELLAAFEVLRDRLWIPHQVALEFQRNRISVIASQRKATETALSSAKNMVADLREKVGALQIEKRGLDIDPVPILENLEKANDQLVAAITAAQKAQVDIAANDAIRDAVDRLIGERVGEGPKSQKDLDELVQDAEARFKDGIPPGFADAGKDKNPANATYFHNHIKYDAKLGDLILWRQILREAKASGLKCLVLVTADGKEDWWRREQGKTIGVHPELIGEIRREAGVELFWMYSSDQFLQQASTYTETKVSSESLQELQQIAVAEPLPSDKIEVAKAILAKAKSRNHQLMLESQEMVERVAAWFTRSGHSPQLRGFPEIVVNEKSGADGYAVLKVNRLGEIHSSKIVRACFMGANLRRAGRLATFSLILVLPEDLAYRVLDDAEPLSSALKKLESFKLDATILGAIINGVFQDLKWYSEGNLIEVEE